MAALSVKRAEYDIKALISYDEAQLAAAVSRLSQSDPETAEAPADAVISEYEEGKGYSILPESEGARLNQERTLKGGRRSHLRSSA